jgi:hypothetical protein
MTVVAEGGSTPVNAWSVGNRQVPGQQEVPLSTPALLRGTHHQHPF